MQEIVRKTQRCSSSSSSSSSADKQVMSEYVFSLEESIYAQALLDRYPFIHYRTLAQKFGHYLPHLLNFALYHEYTVDQLLSLDDETLEKITQQHSHCRETQEARAANQAILKQAAAMQLGEGWLKCGKCGSKEVKFQQKQVRSADEGSTIFCVCQHSQCNHQWRID